jgi:hypothetical protein
MVLVIVVRVSVSVMMDTPVVLVNAFNVQEMGVAQPRENQ